MNTETVFRFKISLNIMTTKLIILASLLLSETSSSTRFAWLPGNSLSEGNCYEIDVESLGQKYRSKVPKSRCKTEETKFVWVQGKNETDGRCFETSLAEGLYAEEVIPKKCYKNVLSVKWVELPKKSVCLKFIEGFEGEEIKQVVSDIECKPPEGTYQFVPNSDKLSGRCFFVSGNFKTDEPLIKCRPSELQYFWLEEKKSCYEAHPQGVELYISKTKDQHCLTEKVNLSFEADIEKMKFTCLEHFKDQSGKTVIKPTTLSKCKKGETHYRFYKVLPLKGYCLEEDKAEGAKAYATLAGLEKCRPGDEYLMSKWFDQKLKLHDYGCFFIDKESGGEKYIEKIDKKNCGEIGVDFLWEPNTDGWSGRCIKQGVIGENKYDVVFKVRECLPQKTIYFWRKTGPYKGECYEIDGSGDRYKYSEKIALDFCKPKLVTDLKYFFHIDEKGIGACYLIDQKTGGEEYSERVKDEKCKTNLVPTSGEPSAKP